MENNHEQPEEPVSHSRPAWQVWMARIGLGLFFLFLILYYWAFFSGGY